MLFNQKIINSTNNQMKVYGDKLNKMIISIDAKKRIKNTSKK